MVEADATAPLGAPIDPANPAVMVSAGLRARLGVAVVDQAVSAGTNVLITLVAARSLGTEEFGVFGVLYLLYLTTNGVVRALVGEPSLVRVPHPRRWLQEVFASGVCVASAVAALIALGGCVLLPANRAAVIAMVALLPAMVVQDVGRYAAFAARRPERALLLDSTWAAVQVVVLALLAWGNRLTLVTVVLAWAGAGAVGGLQALWIHGRVIPVPSLRWIRGSWELSWRYLGAFATTTGIAQGTALALGLAAGVAAVGALRAAQVLFGPLNVLFAGAIAVVVPEAARSDARSPRARRRLVVVSVSLSAAAVVITAVGLALPDRAGRALLGATWPAARELVLPVGLVALLGAVISGADIGLRAARAVRESLGVQLRMAPAQLLLPIAGGIVAGAAGYAWTLVVVTAAAALLWWRTFAHLVPDGAHP